MSDPCCIYTSDELAKLDKKARDVLRKELKEQIQASREIRAMVKADAEIKKVLKEKLADTYEALKKQSKPKSG